MAEQGTISINTENIFPIIKRSLYSDQEIFLRELISNAVDATQKLQKLASIGEYKGEVGDTKIRVEVDKDNSQIIIRDRGIGMTAEEIKKYINQIAFSSASEFIEKFQKQGEEQIIGQFGLGFYSAFMVADKVEINSLSYQEGAKPARWICTGSTEYELEEGEKQERGTDITLYVSEDATEFLESERIRHILNKYCKFLPVEIEFEEEVINNTQPLWIKNPTELTDEDYKNFYKELYPAAEEPLFWIHLNVDYPFNLTGILYFPVIRNNIDVQQNKIHLYSRQVFITENVQDIVPDWLMLLHGVIDSPDIPLNISRSSLQSDSRVKKITNHITKKVADKLKELFKQDRNGFEQKWDDISTFIKYGMISDEKFRERVWDICLYKNTEDQYFTFEEYKEKVKEHQTDKDGNTILLYTTEPGKQDTYIKAAQKKNYDVLVMDNIIDSHFINTIETAAENVNMKRVDADTPDKLIDTGEEKESALTDDQKEKVKEIFKKAIGDENANISVEAMDEDALPVSITQSEFMRRMKDMSQVSGGMNMMGQMPDQNTITINGNHPVIDKILKAKKEENKEKMAKQTYDLALLSQNQLTGNKLTEFIQRSVDLIAQ